MNILITGGCGFIGTNLALKLSKYKKNKIKILDNLWRGNKKYTDNIKNIDIVLGDLTCNSFCLDHIKDVDVVYHLAEIVSGVNFAFNNQSFIFRQNIIINSNVLNACVTNKIKNYIYVGTACSYPKKNQHKRGLNYFKEEDIHPLTPETSYGMSKYLGEYECDLIKGSDMNIGILRLHNVFGPYSSYDDKTSQVIPALIKKIEQDNDSIEIWGSGKQYRDFVYVDDVVDALILVLEKGMNKGVIQIGTGNPTPIQTVAELLVKFNGKNKKIKNDLTKPEGDFGRLAIIEKANNILGWYPKVTFNEGLKRTYEWMKNDMCNKYIFFAMNGIGDKLLDLAGVITLCDYTKKELLIVLNQYEQNFVWGNAIYKKELFKFDKNINVVEKIDDLNINIDIGDKDKNPDCRGNDMFYKDYKIIKVSAGGVLFSPIRIFNYLNQKIEYKVIAEKYIENLNKISDSEILKDFYSPDLSECIGLHLRKSDKVVKRSHNNCSSENEFYGIIVKEMNKYLHDILLKNKGQKFYICSEDIEWKNVYIKYIQERGGIIVDTINKSKMPQIDGFNEVLDIFSLSKCKQIIQGVKSSNFSLVASLLGERKLINFIRDKKGRFSYNKLWSGCVNPEKNFNIEEIKNCDLTLKRYVSNF